MNSDIATIWSSEVLPGKANGAAAATRKKGAQAVVKRILGPRGFSLCLIQPLPTSEVEASSQFPPGLSSPVKCAGVDSLAGYQEDSPLSQSESRVACTAIAAGRSYLVRAD